VDYWSSGEAANLLAKDVPHLKSEEWRKVTHDVRIACGAALVALNSHRAQHQC